MVLESAPRPRKVLVFVPYIDVEGRPESRGYDRDACRAEVERWMTELGMLWEWHAITASNLEIKLAYAMHAAGAQPTIVFNLCDGSQSDGYPGLEVVQGLERSGLGYTGADPFFYAVTTSKAASKKLLAANGVGTASYYLLPPTAKDVEPAIDAVGFPLFLKPDVSAASHGVSLDSPCYNREAAEKKFKQLREGCHGWSYARTGILVEKFLEGREFTVLVAEDADAPMGLWALPAFEVVFDQRIPAHERFMAFERIWELPEENPPLPPGVPQFRYEVADNAHQDALTNIARRAMRAVKGAGYARVDIRSDETGEGFFVLEVNSQCGLFGRSYDTSGSMRTVWDANIVDVVAKIIAHGIERAAHKVGHPDVGAVRAQARR